MTVQTPTRTVQFPSPDWVHDPGPVVHAGFVPNEGDPLADGVTFCGRRNTADRQPKCRPNGPAHRHCAVCAAKLRDLGVSWGCGATP